MNKVKLREPDSGNMALALWCVGVAAVSVAFWLTLIFSIASGLGIMIFAWFALFCGIAVVALVMLQGRLNIAFVHRQISADSRGLQ